MIVARDAQSDGLSPTSSRVSTPRLRTAAMSSTCRHMTSAEDKYAGTLFGSWVIGALRARSVGPSPTSSRASTLKLQPAAISCTCRLMTSAGDRYGGTPSGSQVATVPPVPWDGPSTTSSHALTRRLRPAVTSCTCRLMTSAGDRYGGTPSGSQVATVPPVPWDGHSRIFLGALRRRPLPDTTSSTFRRTTWVAGRFDTTRSGKQGTAARPVSWVGGSTISYRATSRKPLSDGVSSTSKPTTLEQARSDMTESGKTIPME